MTTSNRPSDRAVDPNASSQLRTPVHPNSGGDVRPLSGADGREQLLALKETARKAGDRESPRRLVALRSAVSVRDWSILHALDQLHYLTTRQVERLVFRAGDLTPLSAARTSRRDLTRLHHLQLIRHLDRRIGGLRAGSASYVWTLDQLGGRLLKHTSRRRAMEPSLLHLDHVLAVSELVVQLHEQQRRGVVEILDVQSEPDCWRIIPGPHGGRVTLKPDLRLTLGVGQTELHWFVEIDRATEHRPALARKCGTYLAAWRTGREETEHGVFPRVLWVVPDQARVDVMTSVIDGLPAAPAGLFVTTTTDQAVPTLLGEGGRP
jgi:hypothetical protein